MNIFYYMTVDSFAMFVKSKALRFSRLDQFDDLVEAKPFNSIYNPLAYIFASSHTKDSIENIALWKMYASLNRGVRIQFESNSLFDTKLVSTVFPTNQHKRVEYPQLFVTCLNPNDFANTDYIALSSDDSTDAFIRQRDISYLNNLQEYYDSHLSITDNISDHTRTINCNPLSFGYQKLKYWEFQNESRFLIHTIPYAASAKDINKIVNSAPTLKTTHIFAPLKEEAIKKMVVRLSPNATDSTKFIVESILKSIDNYNIEESDLKGLLRGDLV